MYYTKDINSDNYEIKYMNSYFFIIDSNNYNSVKSNLYGYICNENGIYTRNNYVEDCTTNNPFGAYIFIKKNNATITIEQDYYGSYGLYVFKANKYFAISNSFFLLSEYVSNKYKLSLNNDFFNCLLVNDLCSMSISETPISEIQVLKNNEYIVINDDQIHIESKAYQENCISLDSTEAFHILDQWFLKWTSIIHNVYKNTTNVTFDLSGGFDTRMILSLLLNSNVKLEDIIIKSTNDGLNNHDEDYRIASKIANDFNFSLNTNEDKLLSNKINLPVIVGVMHSFLIKLGFHKEMYIKNQIYENTRILISGCNGESVRGYPNKNVEDYSKTYVQRALPLDWNVRNKVINSIKKLWDHDISYLANKFNLNKNEKILTTFFYNSVRAKNHYGKAMVEAFGGNIINLAPCMDPMLSQLKRDDSECKDETLLMSIIFTRYCPKLLSYPIEGGRHFSVEANNRALELCNKYSFIKKNIETKKNFLIDKLDLSNINNNDFSIKKYDILNIDSFFQKLFTSNKVTNDFINFYSLSTYYYVLNDSKNRKFHPSKHLFTGIALSKVISDIYSYDKCVYNSFADFFNNIKKTDLYQEKQEFYYKETMARIDIMSEYPTDFEIKRLTNDVFVSQPSWIQKNGKGIILETKSSPINISIFSTTGGKIKLRLMGIDKKDANNGERIPLWVDYTLLKINNEILLKKVTPCWHNKHVTFEFTLLKGQINNISILWNKHEIKYP